MIENQGYDHVRDALVPRVMERNLNFQKVLKFLRFITWKHHVGDRPRDCHHVRDEISSWAR